jgi:hypothetical protein
VEWSGYVDIAVSYIKISAEQRQMVDLETMASPGVYYAIVVVIVSDTIML